MAITCGLRAKQVVAGGPIAISASLIAPTFADDSGWGCLAIGVSLINILPATWAGFAHLNNVQIPPNPSSPYFDSAVQSIVDEYVAGVLASWRDTFTISLLQRVDVNYAVARYLWATAWANPAPAGGDAPLASAGPYLIL